MLHQPQGTYHLSVSSSQKKKTDTHCEEYRLHSWNEENNRHIRSFFFAYSY
jgi:hypothetical protein